MLLGQTILHPLCSKSIPFISNKTVLPLMQQNHSKIHWSLYASFCCCGPCSSLFELRRNKNWSKYSPKRTEGPLKRKHLDGKFGKSHPTQPNCQFSGDMLVFRVLYFLGWGWETHQNLPKTAGHSHCNGGGGGMPMAASGPRWVVWRCWMLCIQK